MRKLTFAAICAATTLFGTTAMAADAIEGVWQTQPDDGVLALVQIVPCGPAFCGKIVKSYRGKEEVKSANTGKQIVIDMKPGGEGKYTGKVLRPADNKVYNGKVAISGKSMKLSGCVAGGLICKSQTWTKVQ